MSSIVVAGDTSGSVTLSAPAVSGSSVLTLPVATDTLVGKATTDTLTNKSIAVTQLTGTLAVANGGSGVTTSTGSGANVLGTSPTITTPTISSLSSASATALTLQSAGTTAITVDTSQNVGIGTNSPATKLTVYNSTAIDTRTRTQNSFQAIDVGVDSSGVAIVAGSGAYPLGIYTNSTERMRIDSSGNLLVGTTTATPIVGLALKGLGFSNDFTTGSAIQVNTTNTSGTSYFLGFARGTTICGNISSAGANSTSYATSSDYRLKENIVPMTGALDKVALLKPVTYKWKIDGSSSEGFIAHELQAVVPNAVVGEKDAVDEDGNIKPQGIDTSFLVATLTAAIQELKAIVDTQAERIKALEAKP